VALAPDTAQAAADNWTGATSNDWSISTNWSAGVPTATSAVTISNLANNPVQINTNVLLNGSTGSLTVGTGVAPGQANGLNINSGDTLTMGARPVTLDGGSITGLGTLSSTGGISGYGTISSLISGTTFTANATDGTAFGGFSPFVNGTPGTAITLIGQNNLASDSFTIQNHGDFNFQGVTLTTPTLNGVSTNLNAGSVGGNNYYGLFTFTGAASTVVGQVNNTNYQQFDINGATVHLNNFSLTNSWATNVPPFFVINSGGTLDNTVGNSNLTGHMAVVLNGGSLTNSGGGTFTAPGLITGYGLVSGPLAAEGGIKATGGTLTVDGTSGSGVTAASAGWGTGGGASDVLDLKGAINFSPINGFPAAPGLNPSGATVQLDNATISTTGGSGLIQTGSGQFVVATGVNTLNGSFTPNGSNSAVANFIIKNGATLNVNSTVGSISAIWANNFTMENGSQFSIAGANASIHVAGNFVTQQTDATHAWTYNSVAGLGADVIMSGGSMAAPVMIEVGGVNEGNVAAGYVDNFALDSLSLGSGAYVALVDRLANATSSGWTSGSEALYLDGLFGVLPGGSSIIPTLNLENLHAYLEGVGALTNGLYVDAYGGEINVIGAPAPEASTYVMMLVGFAGLSLGAVHRKRNRLGSAFT
jgi:hypothetical protein